MAPKIRGVCPPMRRYGKSDLGVKKAQKGDAVKLRKGDLVDVRLEEEGLYGSWHPGVIFGVKRGLRQVKIQTLLDEKNNPVREWVPFGKEKHDITFPLFPLGTRKLSDRSAIRPRGPGLPPSEPSFRKTGGWPKDLWVEVYADEAWWEGVLAEDISAAQMNEEDSVVDVAFPQLGDLIEQVALKNLRECKDWNEDTGLWSIRGRLVMDDDHPVPTMPARQGSEQFAVVVPDNSEPTSRACLDAEDQEGGLVTTARAQNPSVSPAPFRVQQWSAESKSTGSYGFGHLTELVEEKSHFLLMVETMGYNLEQMQITVKDGFLTLEVSTPVLEMGIGMFTCQLGGSLSSRLRLPTDATIDHDRVGWELESGVLTVTVPKVL